MCVPFPAVSILVAARNEESRLLDCLHALAGLTYPKEKLDIWIGDDDSSDATCSIAEAFIAGRPHFHLFKSRGNIGQVRGKANMLAQLAGQSRGRYLCITDADVRVPPGWVEALLAAAAPGVGIVTGVTVPVGSGAWAAMQSLEWAGSLYGMYVLAIYGVPVTAMGNNMLVTRESYLATGGYENIPFSITEDYQLFREVLARGYGFAQVFMPEALALTVPSPTAGAWLHQRKRWMHGALRLAWPLRLPLFVPAATVPVLLGLAWLRPGLAALLWVGIMAVQVTVLGVALRRLRLRRLGRFAWLFPLYLHLGAVAALFFYCLPRPVLWKGRRYP